MADRQLVSIEVTEEVAARLREDASTYGFENVSDVIEEALDALCELGSERPLSDQQIGDMAREALASREDGDPGYSLEEVRAFLKADHRDGPTGEH